MIVCVEYHGTSGPLGVATPEVSPLGEAFVNAGAQLGYPVHDVNGEDHIGRSHLPRMNIA